MAEEDEIRGILSTNFSWRDIRATDPILRFKQQVVEHAGRFYGFDTKTQTLVLLKNPQENDAATKDIISNSVGVEIGTGKKSDHSEVQWYVHLPHKYTGGMAELYCYSIRKSGFGILERKCLQLVRGAEGRLKLYITPGFGRHVLSPKEQNCEIRVARWHLTRPDNLMVSYVENQRIYFALLDVSGELVTEVKTINLYDMSVANSYGEFYWSTSGDLLIPYYQDLIYARDELWDDLDKPFALNSMRVKIFDRTKTDEADEFIRHVGTHKGFTYIASNKAVYASTDITIGMKKIASLSDVYGIIDQFIVTTGGVYEVDGFRIWNLSTDTVCALIPQTAKPPLMITLDGTLCKRDQPEDCVTDMIDALAARVRALQERKRELQKREREIERREQEVNDSIGKLQQLAKKVVNPTDLEGALHAAKRFLNQ